MRARGIYELLLLPELLPDLELEEELPDPLEPELLELPDPELLDPLELEPPELLDPESLDPLELEPPELLEPLELPLSSELSLLELDPLEPELEPLLELPLVEELEPELELVPEPELVLELEPLLPCESISSRVFSDGLIAKNRLLALAMVDADHGRDETSDEVGSKTVTEPSSFMLTTSAQ